MCIYDNLPKWNNWGLEIYFIEADICFKINMFLHNRFHKCPAGLGYWSHRISVPPPTGARNRRKVNVKIGRKNTAIFDSTYDPKLHFLENIIINKHIMPVS